jgi:hypothetical protein
MSDSPLPPLYDRWIMELTGDELAGEPAATCLDCVMLAPGDGLGSFEPSTKCCTYTPEIPNFLVGAALADPQLDEVGGRQSLRDRIGRRAGVSPLGLARDRVTRLIAERAVPAFGQAPSLRCPHYHAETGKCGVWLHRNAVCSTWFCKHGRGAVGRSFWHVLRNLLNHVEIELARWCVLELGAPYDVQGPPEPWKSPKGLTRSDLEHTVTDADYAAAWGDWIGREEELYGRAARLVGDLDWADVVQICGPEVPLRMRALDEARKRRATGVVPKALVLRKLSILRDGDPVILESYSDTDPVSAPAVLLDLLPSFRGQPTREARDEIARDADIELDDELLVRLVDFGVLADAGGDS